MGNNNNGLKAQQRQKRSTNDHLFDARRARESSRVVIVLEDAKKRTDECNDDTSDRTRCAKTKFDDARLLEKNCDVVIVCREEEKGCRASVPRAGLRCRVYPRRGGSWRIASRRGYPGSLLELGRSDRLLGPHHG